MSNNFAEALKNAGIEVSESGFKRYETFEDVVIPFGSMISCDESNRGLPYYSEALSSFNSVRQELIDFNIDQFDYTRGNKDYIYRFLAKNAKRCKILPDWNHMKIFTEGNLHGCITEHELDHDLPNLYGVNDLIFKFVYSTQYERFLFRFYLQNLNLKKSYQSFLSDDIRRKDFDHSVFFGTENDMDKMKPMFDYCVKNIFPKAEFLPVEVLANDGVVISHRAYRDKFGPHDEVTSPCLGKNIKKNDSIMDRLSIWLKNGGYIRDSNLYLIIENRKAGDGSLYLLPYKQKSEG